jgi:hypothetical protein
VTPLLFFVELRADRLAGVRGGKSRQPQQPVRGNAMKKGSPRSPEGTIPNRISQRQIDVAIEEIDPIRAGFNSNKSIS